MAGLFVNGEVRSLVCGELFLLHCVMICRRQSNGKILLDHYRHQRRHFAGDERVCHQPVTATRRETEVPLRLFKNRAPAPSRKIAPKPDEVIARL
jgi:hypothetical protein